MPLRRCTLLVLAAQWACASTRLLPLPAASGPSQPLPVQYEKTSFLFFKSQQNDGLLQRFVASGPVVLATVLRPQTGVFASSDQGAAWTYAPMAELPRQVVFDPADPRKLYARAGTRVLHSADGGRSWTASQPGQAAVDALAMGAGGAVLAAAGPGLFVSEDGTRTWRAIPPPVQAKTHWWVRSVAADPGHPGTIYASVHVDEEQPKDLFTRFVALLDYASDEAVSALALADSNDKPRPIAWNGAGGNGVYVTQDGGGLWKKTGLALDAIVVAQGSALYAVPADPILQAAALVRRYPDLAALAGRQMHGDRADPPGLRAACRFPGRDKLLQGPLAAALVLRSDDGGASWSRLIDAPLPLMLALREALERLFWEPQFVAAPKPQQPRQPQLQRAPPRGSRYQGLANPQRTGVPQALRGGVAPETLLAFVDPMRLLAHYNGAPLSGVSGGVAYAATEARWNALADTLANQSGSEGEISLGPGALPAHAGAEYELLRSPDGASWQPQQVELAARPGAFPESVAATADQIFLLLGGHDRPGQRWRAAFRVSK